MELLAMLHADPLDLLFENRTKLYSAYPLRIHFKQRLLISLGFTFTLIVISSVLYFHNTASSVFIPNRLILPDVILRDGKLTPEIKSPVQWQRANATNSSATVIYNIPFIVVDQRALDDIAKNDQLRTAAIGVTTSAGNLDGEPHNVTAAAGSPVAKPDLVEEKPKILDRA